MALGFRSVVILRSQPIITITTVSYSVLKRDIEVQSTVCDRVKTEHGNDSIEGFLLKSVTKVLCT